MKPLLACHVAQGVGPSDSGNLLPSRTLDVTARRHSTVGVRVTLDSSENERLTINSNRLAFFRSIVSRVTLRSLTRFTLGIENAVLTAGNCEQLLGFIGKS